MTALAARPRQPPLSPEQRCALEVLADTGLNGATESILRAHGFTIDLLVSLVRAGLANAASEKVRVGDQWIEVARVRITDAGRRARIAPFVGEGQPREDHGSECSHTPYKG
jgi:hypothetical protein